jgi:hypothetical protein
MKRMGQSVVCCLMLACAPCMAANAIRDLINAAIASRQTEVTIPAGTYRVNEVLWLNRVNDFTVNAENVVMIMEVRTQAVSIANSRNLSIRGLTIDHQPLPYTQATITSHAADWSSVDARIHDGYPQDPRAASKIEAYDGRTGRLIPDVWTLYDVPVEKLSATTVRIRGTSGFNGKVRVGDKVTLDCPQVLPHAVVIEKSEGCVFKNITLHTSTSFGFLENNSHGNRYDGIRIVPGPPLVPGGEPRLKSANADGIHSKHATLGPVIENCEIIAPGDDGIAINGDYDVILGVAGEVISIASKRETEIQAGDVVRSFSREGVLNFEASVLGIVRETGNLAQLQATLAALGMREPSLFRDFFRITLSKAVTAQPGSPVEAANRKGNGFIVRNNTIGYKRARGILVKAEDGLIEGNTIEWNGMAGILLTPELYWMEAGFSRRVRIINNTLRYCGFNPSNAGTTQAGVITVSAEGAREFAPAGGHLGIEISGNRIAESFGVQILATSISGLAIMDNVLVDTHREARTHGQSRGVNPRAAVSIINCDNVMVRNNVLERFGGTAPLQAVAIFARTAGSDAIPVTFTETDGVVFQNAVEGGARAVAVRPVHLTPPTFASQPQSVAVRSGGMLALTAGVTGTDPLTYQWYKDGVAVPGAHGAMMVIDEATPANAAGYTVRVSNALGTVMSARAEVRVLEGALPGRLANLSARSRVGAGEAVLIVGFVLSGEGVGGARPLLVRGIGPALAAFGVPGVLSDPMLTLFAGSAAIRTNDDWGGDPQIGAVAARVGAFEMHRTSKDAALYLAEQAPGGFTVHLAGVGARTGVGLVEIYDAASVGDLGIPPVRLVNVSVRAPVGRGEDILIGGFVIDGPAAQTVLVRGVGPALAQHGVPGALKDPRLELFQGGTKVAENDDWAGAPSIVAAAARVSAFSLGSATTKDAALLVTLPPGLYTAQVSGVDGATGVGMVEIYVMP